MRIKKTENNIPMPLVSQTNMDAPPVVLPFYLRLCPAIVLLSDNEFRGIDVLIGALLLYASKAEGNDGRAGKLRKRF